MQSTAKRTTAKENAKMLLFVCFLGVLCIGIILLSAYTANAQYDLNKINTRCNTLKSEIADVSARLESESNITRIEDRALALGMMYPTFRETINLTAGAYQDTDLAAALKTVAFQAE